METTVTIENQNETETIVEGTELTNEGTTYGASAYLTNDNKATGRAEVINDAIRFMESKGVSVEDTVKAITLFDGPNAFCGLKTRKLHIAYVNEVMDELDFHLDNLTGRLELTGMNTTIHLREDCDQHLFLVAYERMAPPTIGSTEVSKFWSFSLVCLETKGTLPLALGLDLNKSQTAYFMRFSSAMYNRPITLSDGSTSRENRLRDIHGKSNLESMLATVAQLCKFPIEGAREFPNSREQTSSNARRGVFTPPTQSSPNNSGDTSFTDPFTPKSE